MKKFFYIVPLLLNYVGFAQEFYANPTKSETVITTKDSVPFYMEKYRDLSNAIQITKIKSMRVSFIYLNSDVMGLDAINVLRETIISDYKKGKPFTELANRYTMDPIAKDGDLNWFDEGMMVKVFEDEIKKHKKGDVFTVDIPENKWYYVVLKTYDDIPKVKLEITLK